MSDTGSPEKLTSSIAYIFALGGLIREKDWKTLQAKEEALKPLSEVLTQSAFSLGTYTDLLTKAELNPFRQQKGDSQLLADLSQVLELSRSELAFLLDHHSPPVELLGRTLELAGVARLETIQAQYTEAVENSDQPYTYMVEHNQLTPIHIKALLGSNNNPLTQLSAMVLSLAILQHNGLVDQDDFVNLVATTNVYDADNEANLSALRGRARDIIKAPPDDLVHLLKNKISLPQIPPSKLHVDEKLFGMFPVTMMRRLSFIPMAVDDDQIVIATSDPLNVQLASVIRWVSSRWVHPIFSTASGIRTALDQYAGPEKTGKNKQEFSDALVDSAGDDTPMEVSEVPLDSLSAVQLVSSLIESAIEVNATDIHLEPERDLMAVRFRIDGVLKRILDIPNNLKAPVCSRIKILGKMDVTERRRPQDGHIALQSGDRHFDFRIATLPTYFGEKVAIRILDSARVMTGLEELGMEAKQLETAQGLIRMPYGIILVTGPTGSGKTSTLYAALQDLNSEGTQIITIEDPIEYQLDGINQVQVEASHGLSFSDGLRAVLRQDPNIIMVGEIRDSDTALTAIRAAMTGHLVFSTLHTNTALGAVQALSNLSATPYMIGAAVGGVIAQRLVRRLCPKCKKKGPVPKAMAQQLGLTYSNKRRWYHPVGCEECLDSGYSGRLGLFELLEVSGELQQAILDEKSPRTLAKIARDAGMMSIREAGLEKIKAGETSPEEVIEKVMLDV